MTIDYRGEDAEDFLRNRAGLAELLGVTEEEAEQFYQRKIRGSRRGGARELSHSTQALMDEKLKK